jgi:hypothetical protein
MLLKDKGYLLMSNETDIIERTGIVTVYTTLTDSLSPITKEVEDWAKEELLAKLMLAVQKRISDDRYYTVHFFPVQVETHIEKGSPLIETFTQEALITLTYIYQVEVGELVTFTTLYPGPERYRAPRVIHYDKEFELYTHWIKQKHGYALIKKSRTKE